MARRKRIKIPKVVSKLAMIAADAPIGDYASDPKQARDALQRLIGKESVEVVAILLLNVRHQILGWAEVSRGTVSSSIVHPREIFAIALRIGASAIILAHNHPSGDPHPSFEDHEVTNRIKQSGELLGIPLLDHIVCSSSGGTYSMREGGVGTTAHLGPALGF